MFDLQAGRKEAAVLSEASYRALRKRPRPPKYGYRQLCLFNGQLGQGPGCIDRQRV